MTIKILHRAACVLFCALAGLTVWHSAFGQEGPTVNRGPRPFADNSPIAELPNTYGSLDAGWEAYRRAETERRQAIDRQLLYNEGLKRPFGLPIYRSYPSGVGSYDTRSWRPTVSSSRRAYRCTCSEYPALEPWPVLSRFLYGYGGPYIDRVEQLLGQRIIPTGPNGYISRPVYPSDLQSRQEPTPAPAPAGPIVPGPEPIPAPSDPAPGPAPESIPAPVPESGPREL